MKTLPRFPKFVAASTAAVYLLVSCGQSPTDSGGGAEAGHEHTEGDGHDHEGDGHDHEHEGDEHEGVPVVLHDGARGVYTELHVTYFRPTTSPVVELAFELEVVGPSGTIRGYVKSASGATSLPTRAEAEGEPGGYHLHLGELPKDLDAGSAVLVLELEPQGDKKVTVELPLAPG